MFIVYVPFLLSEAVRTRHPAFGFLHTDTSGVLRPRRLFSAAFTENSGVVPEIVAAPMKPPGRNDGADDRPDGGRYRSGGRPHKNGHEHRNNDPTAHDPRNSSLHTVPRSIPVVSCQCAAPRWRASPLRRWCETPLSQR